MSFQAYLDTVHAKTGKTPADFALLAQQKSLTKHGELVAWLKQDFALGHGHANAVVAALLKSEARATPIEDKLGKLFAGKKAVWQPACAALLEQIKDFGDDVVIAPNETYINILRGKKKFAILQMSTLERVDIGVKLKALEPTDRLELSGSWNSMVTHRVSITDSSQLDAQVLEWLRLAYVAVSSA